MQIDSELLSLESSLSSNISSLEQAYSSLTSQFDTMSSVFSGELSNIPTCFNGGNASFSIEEEINTLNRKSKDMTQKIKTELLDIINRTKALLANIGTLKEKLAAAQVASDRYNSYCMYNAETLKEKGISLSYYRADKDNKIDDFYDYQAALKAELASLKAADISLESLSSGPITSLGDINIISSEFKRLEYEYNGKLYEYMLYVPEIEGIDQLPLVTFFHGNEQSNSEYSINKIPVIQALSEGREYPGIVLIPLTGRGDSFTNDKMVEMANELTDQIISEYNVDTSKVAITGYSGGGVGTFKALSYHPEKYSAAAIVSAYTTQKNCDKIAELDLPIRLVTGPQDTMNKNNITNTYNYLKKANSDLDIQLDSIPGVEGSHGGLDDWSYYSNDIISELFEDMYNIDPLNNPVEEGI